MTTYHAYRNRRGFLIVNRYLGTSEHQRLKPVIKSEIGVFQATDILAARHIAHQLTGAA